MIGKVIRPRFVNGDGLEWACLYDYLCEHPAASARIRLPGRIHTGYLTAELVRTSDGVLRVDLQVRDNRRGARSQYQTVQSIDDLELWTTAGHYMPARGVVIGGDGR